MKETLRLLLHGGAARGPRLKRVIFIDLIEGVRSKRLTWTRRGEPSVHMFLGRRRLSFFLAQHRDLRHEVV
jgi:hypothetical protein